MFCLIISTFFGIADNSFSLCDDGFICFPKFDEKRMQVNKKRPKKKLRRFSKNSPKFYVNKSMGKSAIYMSERTQRWLCWNNRQRRGRERERYWSANIQKSKSQPKYTLRQQESDSSNRSTSSSTNRFRTEHMSNCRIQLNGKLENWTTISNTHLSKYTVELQLLPLQPKLCPISSKRRTTIRTLTDCWGAIHCMWLIIWCYFTIVGNDLSLQSQWARKGIHTTAQWVPNVMKWNAKYSKRKRETTKTQSQATAL